jgi:hexokinase
MYLGTAMLLERLDRADTTIAVDGSLYKYHPRLKSWMKKYIRLLAPGKKVSLCYKINLRCSIM